MGFGIRFVNDQIIHEDNERCLCGTILLGDLDEEAFHAPISYWTRLNYEQHWRDGLLRILSGAESSCLITLMYDPRLANFINWWPMYRVDDLVMVQNHLLFMDQLSVAFDEKNPFQSIKPRQTVTPEGEKVSEWSIEIGEIQSFYKTL
jgi:hypothetical protein